MKRIGMLMLYVCTTLLLHGQQLQINKPFPLEEMSLEIRNVIQQGVGKHMIIDLFASGCSVCFSSLPKIKELQGRFNGRLQFVLVGKRDERIKKIYQRFATNYKLSFPVVYDSFFHQQAGTGYFPTYIWIDRAGIIKAITGAADITERKLTVFLKDQPIPEKSETNSFDSNRPYLVNGNGGTDSNFLYRSILTEWREGQPVYLPVRIKGGRSLQLLGATLDQLYRYAYTGKWFWSEIDSLYLDFYSLPVVEGEYQGGSFATRYSYSLMTADNLDKEMLRAMMKDDLNRSLPFLARVERRLMPYWKLELVGRDTSRVASRSTSKAGEWTHAGIDMQALPIGELLSILHSYYPLGPVFINETGVLGKIDIRMDAVWQDLTSLRNGLRQAGFDLQQGYRWMNVVVLTEKQRSVAGHFKTSKN